MSSDFKNLVLFDFDWTMIDEDSDHFILHQLAPDLVGVMEELKFKMQWTDLMHHLYAEAYKQGVTKAKVIEQCRLLPLQPAMIETLQHLRTHGNADIIIVSDANHVFIDECLQVHGVRHLVSRIITNPAQFDEQGRLHIRRRLVEGVDSPHGCRVGTCPLNMCKGTELIAIRDGGPTLYDTVVYVGDGRNDYCPCLHLSRTDHVLARRDRTLQRLLLENRPSLEELNQREEHEDKIMMLSGSPNAVSLAQIQPQAKLKKVAANVHFWSTAEDVLDKMRVIFPEVK